MTLRHRPATRPKLPRARRAGAGIRRGWQAYHYADRDHASRLNEEELKRLTKEQLVLLARDEELPNRSKMNKAQLARTLRRHYRRAAR